MFQEHRLAPLLKIYDAVHVLEVKVLDPLLLKLYIEKANEYNKVTFDDPINAGMHCYNNHFQFYLPKEAVLSRAKKYTPFKLNIQLKKYIEKNDKRFHTEHIRFHNDKYNCNYLHLLDLRKMQTNISGVFMCYGKDLTLPMDHACFRYDHVVNEPVYIKIVDSFTYNEPIQILTSGYHGGGTFHDGYNPDKEV